MQKWMSAPVFKYGEHYDLDGDAILPFIDFPDYGIKVGAYSEILIRRIHPCHNNFWGSFQDRVCRYYSYSIDVSWLNFDRINGWSPLRDLVLMRKVSSEGSGLFSRCLLH